MYLTSIEIVVRDDDDDDDDDDVVVVIMVLMFKASVYLIYFVVSLLCIFSICILYT